MKPRLIWALAIAGTAVSVAVASSFAGQTALDRFQGALASAKALDVTFTVRELGGAPSEYHVTLARPNKAKIVTPEQTFVADGKTITVYLKKDNAYYKKPETDAALLAAFDDPGLSVWSGFFDANARGRYANATDQGKVTLGGVEYDVVKSAADQRSGTATTYYISAKDNLARKVEFQTVTKGQNQSTLLNASSVSLSAPDVFAFKAPGDAKEVDEDSLTAGHWLNDWDQAFALAKSTDKLVMVDFMASWCGPCKELDANDFDTDAFRAASKDFILLKIDIDQQPALAQRYGVDAIPNVQFMDSKGSVVHKWLGYIPLDQVLDHMKAAKSRLP